MGEAIKLDGQELQLGFLPGPIPMEVPGNEESLGSFVRQGACCRQDDRAPLCLGFHEMRQRDLVEDFRIDRFPRLAIDDLDRYLSQNHQLCFCLSWSSKKSFSPRVMRASTS